MHLVEKRSLWWMLIWYGVHKRRGNLNTNIHRGGEGNGTPLQYSCLENPMDRGAWWAAVHGVAKSRTWLSNPIFTFHFHELEKEMATHSSVLAWRIPGMGELGGLPSMGSHRVRHNWSDLAAAAAAFTEGRWCRDVSNARWWLRQRLEWCCHSYTNFQKD